MSTSQDIVIAVIVVTILFFLFAAFTVSYFLIFRQSKQKHRLQMEASRKEFEQHLRQVQVEVQESTYQHIAKELHDNVCQLLGSTKMLLAVTGKKLGQVPDSLTSADETLGKAIQEIRMLSRSMDKDWLEQFDFLQNLYAEVKRINDGEQVRAEVKGEAHISMPPEKQIILFRIVQEAIQNALRHAEPTMLNVMISNGQELDIKVINDGKPLPANFNGMGTNNMRHRAKLFGGTINWQSVAQQTVVTISLPVIQLHEN